MPSILFLLLLIGLEDDLVVIVDPHVVVAQGHALGYPEVVGLDTVKDGVGIEGLLVFPAVFLQFGLYHEKLLVAGTEI